VRVVAATNRDLEKEMEREQFREDLYYRLNVFSLYLPPLRERPEDVLPLAKYFIRRAASAAAIDPPALTSDAAAALGDYRWPGNVRELRHVIERAVAGSSGGRISLVDLPSEVLDQPSADAGMSAERRPTLEQVERRYIASTLRQVRGNQTEAARILGISRKALWEKRKRYGLE